MVDAGSIVSGVASAIGVGDQHTQNERNIKFQKKLLKYQKKLQREIFEREDNAIVRRVADLRNAGLNKILAAGQGAGTGAVVSTKAPQSVAPDWGSISGPAMNVLSDIQMKEQIDQTIAQKNLNEKLAIKAQTDAMASLQSGKKTALENEILKIRLGAMGTSGQSGESVFGKMVNDYFGMLNRAFNNTTPAEQAGFDQGMKRLDNLGKDVTKLPPDRVPSTNKIAPSQGNQNYSGSW